MQGNRARWTLIGAVLAGLALVVTVACRTGAGR